MDVIGDRYLPKAPAAVIAGLLAFIGVGVVIGVRQETPGGGSAAAPREPALAAAWVSRELTRSETVGCDPVDCPALRRAGVPTTAVALATVVVIAAPTQNAATPNLLAAFGDGEGRVEVRTVAVPAGDRQARATVGAELLRNPNLKIATQARAALSEGRVDARILSVLGGLTADHTVSVTGFGPAAPGADADSELRVVEIDRVDTTPVTSATTTIMRFLTAQTAAFRPADTAVTAGVLRLHYRAPDPVGFFGPK